MAYTYKIGGKDIEFEKEPTSKDIAEARSYVQSLSSQGNEGDAPSLYKSVGITSAPKVKTSTYRGSMFEKKGDEGLLSNIGKSMVSGIVGSTKLATAPIIASDAAKQREYFVQEQSNILTNLIAEKRRLQNRGQNTSRIDRAMQLLQEDTGQTVSELVPEVNATIDEVFGTFAEGALDLATGGASGGIVKEGAKVGLKQAIKEGAKTGLKEGAKMGSLYGVNEGIKEGNNLGESLARGVIGGTVGGLTGSALGGVGAGISSAIGKYTDKARRAEQGLLVKTNKAKERVLKENLQAHADELFSPENVDKYAVEKFNFPDNSFIRSQTGEIDDAVFNELADEARLSLKTDIAIGNNDVIKAFNEELAKVPKTEGGIKSAYITSAETFGMVKPEDILTLSKNGKKITDAEAKVLANNGMVTSDIQILKSIPSRDRELVKAMINGTKNRISNPTETFRPYESIADTVVQKVNAVDNYRKKVGSELGTLRKSLKNVSINSQDTLNSFSKKLTNDGVNILEDGTLDFSASRIRNSDQAKNAIKQAYEGVRDNLNKNGEASDADILVSAISDKLSEDSFKKDGGYARILLADLANDINNKISDKSSSYKQLKKAYSETVDAMGSIDKLVGGSFDPKDKGAVKKIGELLRRLDSNASANAEKVFSQVDDMAQMSGMPKSNLVLLTKIAGILEDGARFTPGNSLKGQMAGAVKDTVLASKELLKGNVGSAASGVMSVLRPDSKLTPTEFVQLIEKIVTRD